MIIMWKILQTPEINQGLSLALHVNVWDCVYNAGEYWRIVPDMMWPRVTDNVSDSRVCFWARMIHTGSVFEKFRPPSHYRSFPDQRKSFSGWKHAFHVLTHTHTHTQWRAGGLVLLWVMNIHLIQNTETLQTLSKWNYCILKCVKMQFCKCNATARAVIQCCYC